MIENNPTNVSSAFEMLLEEAGIDFVNNVGAKAFEARDYDKAKEALKGFRQGRGDVICGSNSATP